MVPWLNHGSMVVTNSAQAQLYWDMHTITCFRHVVSPLGTAINDLETTRLLEPQTDTADPGKVDSRSGKVVVKEKRKLMWFDPG